MEAARAVIRTRNATPVAPGLAAPFSLWFARRATTVLDRALGVGGGAINAPAELERVLAHKRKRFEANAKQRLSAETGIEAGDYVLISVRARGKLSARWSGPFRVLEKLSPQLFKVYRKKYGKLVEDVMHAQKLQKFRMGDRLQDVQHLGFDEPRGLRVKKSTIDGVDWGVIATTEVPAGTDLGSYTGEHLSAAEFEERYPQGDAGFTLRVRADHYIDARDPFRSNWSRFVNQCGPQEATNVCWRRRGDELHLCTTSAIVPGEELLVDPLTDDAVMHAVAERKASANAKLGRRVRREAEQQVALELREESDAEDELDEGQEPEALRLVDEPEPPAVDSMVICAHENYEDGWLLGRVLELSEEDDGWAKVWVYGTYGRGKTAMHKRVYCPAWRDPQDNKTVYTDCSKQRYEKYFVWVQLADVLVQDIVLVGTRSSCLPREVYDLAVEVLARR